MSILSETELKQRSTFLNTQQMSKCVCVCPFCYPYTSITVCVCLGMPIDSLSSCFVNSCKILRIKPFNKWQFLSKN